MAETAVKVKTSQRKPMGTYVPPAKRVKAEKFDVGSDDHQRLTWDEHKKKITGLINRASPSNITLIIKDLFNCNLIRYKGLFALAILKAQEASPKFTDVYAAILAVINSRIRTIGLLVINRLILQFRVSFINNNKAKCLASARFIAHLTNQEVVHEVLGFQLIDLLINQPTPSSIEIVTEFLGECGSKLSQLNPTYLFEVFKTLRNLSLDNELDSRTHELIDLVHLKRKEKFRDNPPVKKELDLVDEEDRVDVTHTVELSTPSKDDYHLEYNYYKYDPKWAENEAKYDDFKQSLLEHGDSDQEDDGKSASGDEDNDDDDGDVEDEDEKKPVIDGSNGVVKPEKVIDATGADLTAFRRMVYLTIRSSVRHEEVVHKLLKSNISSELHDELCQMILDCCGQERTYEAIYGLVASKLCQINGRNYAPRFESLLAQFYEVVHRFETNKIRNVAKFYAHLLTTESIDWNCLSCIKLREDATSSAGRCFVKFLFQELVAVLSLATLKEYIKERENDDGFRDIFPKDPEQDTRFAINFFTFSGLGELTEDLRQVLEAQQ